MCDVAVVRRKMNVNGSVRYVNYYLDDMTLKMDETISFTVRNDLDVMKCDFTVPRTNETIRIIDAAVNDYIVEHADSMNYTLL